MRQHWTAPAVTSVGRCRRWTAASWRVWSSWLSCFRKLGKLLCLCFFCFSSSSSFFSSSVPFARLQRSTFSCTSSQLTWASPYRGTNELSRQPTVLKFERNGALILANYRQTFQCDKDTQVSAVVCTFTLLRVWTTMSKKEKGGFFFCV